MYFLWQSLNEKEAFEKAMGMLDYLGITIDSVRLDKYYSQPSYVDRFQGSKVYIIPKANCTIKGSQRWKSTLKEFLKDTESYLQEYYRRESSEAAFSADKSALLTIERDLQAEYIVPPPALRLAQSLNLNGLICPRRNNSENIENKIFHIKFCP